MHVVVGTSSVVGVVVDGGVWLLDSIVWLLWQKRGVVNTVVVLGSGVSLVVPELMVSSRRSGADRRGGTTARGMRWTMGKKARSRRLTAPRLELVAVVEVEEPGASPGKVSARGELGGHCNDGAAAIASLGADELEGEREERGERAC